MCGFFVDGIFLVVVVGMIFGGLGLVFCFVFVCLCLFQFVLVFSFRKEIPL